MHVAAMGALDDLATAGILINAGLDPTIKDKNEMTAHGGPSGSLARWPWRCFVLQ